MNYNNDMDQNLNSQPTVDSSAPLTSDEQNRRDLVKKLGQFAIYAAPFTVMAMNAKAATASGSAPSARRGAGR